MAIKLQQTSEWIDGGDRNGRQNAGETVQFRFIVNNDGATRISGLILTDPLVSIDLGSFDGTLEAGESIELTGSYGLTQSDIDQGLVRNTTVVSDAGGAALTRVENTTPLTRISVLAVAKDVEVNEFEGLEDGSYDVGDRVAYSYRVTNDGNTTLFNVTLADDDGTSANANVILSGLSDQDGDGDADDLAVGQTATGMLKSFLTQTALDEGIVATVATARARNAGNRPVIGVGSAVVEIEQVPEISVLKTATIQDSNGNGTADIGERVVYSYSLENTGNVSLIDVTLVDDNGTPDNLSDDVTITALTSSSPDGTLLVDSAENAIAPDLFDADGDGSLDDLVVGGSVTATYTTTITEAIAAAGSLTNGSLTNIVIGSGTSPNGETVEDEDEATVTTLLPEPGLALTKFTSATAFSDPATLIAPTELTAAIALAAGEAVYWIYAVENTGNVAFQPDQIVITDDNGTPDDASDDGLIVPVLLSETDSNGNGQLDAGETWYYQAEGIAQDLSFEYDFDTEQAFTAGDDAATLNAAYAALGVQISTPVVGGLEEAANRAMIFDTANPTGGDFDLGTPHGSLGQGRGRGEGAGTGNDTPLGNVLIISEDGDSADPDDNADGGVLRLDWTARPVRLTGVNLLDIDRDEDVTVQTGIGGGEIATYNATASGDNSYQTVAIAGEFADQLSVNFEHSGAIAGVTGIGLYQNRALLTAIYNGETFTDTSDSFYTNSMDMGEADMPSRSPSILFVTGSSDSVQDAALQARLMENGFSVMVQDDDGIAVSDADGKDLVLISESVLSSKVGETFTDSAIAVLTWEAFLYDDLGMATEGNYGIASGKSVDLLGSGIEFSGIEFSGESEVYEGEGLLSWGRPAEGAVVAATLAEGSDRATLFAYETDAILASGAMAPAKRVGFFGHRDASPLSQEGMALFDAAVAYALS